MNFILTLVFYMLANWKMDQHGMDFWERFVVFTLILIGTAFI